MISLALTTYNRYEMLLEAFEAVINEEMISEIVISDDCSDAKYWKKIKDLPHYNPKIKVFRNEGNVGMSLNKKTVVEKCSNQWVILFDSDNKLGKTYLDAIPQELDDNRIYLPDFAKPQFDFRRFAGLEISKKNIISLINDNLINLMLNTCNYLVPRENYLKRYSFDHSIRGSDTIHFAWLWLKGGGEMKVVSGMEYFHRVHDGSGWMEHSDYNLSKAEQIKKKISQL